MTVPRSPLAVVVLAAGAGRRLAGANGGRPKWLTEVGGSPIAEHQLAALEVVPGGDGLVLVVGGHRVDEVRGWLDARDGPLVVQVVDNERYDELNNWYSLLVALRALRARRWAGPVAVLNSDLCAAPRWYEAFLRAFPGGHPTPGVVAVDLERALTEEAMKVSAGRDEDGELRCRRIGKVGVADPVGEYVGMASFDRSGWHELLEVLAGFESQPHRADAWYEAGIQVLMDRGRVTAWPVIDSAWVEIDDEVDLATARQLLEPT